MQKKHTLVWLVACATFAIGSRAQSTSAQEAIFLVRHAERLDQSDDSPLSPAGRARAEHLARILRDARITDIYVTEFQRTGQTAKPLADLLGLRARTTSAADPGALIAKLRALKGHARALVVSHSDRLPILLHDLGARDDITIERNEYDDLFLVVPGDRTGTSVVMRLRY